MQFVLIQVCIQNTKCISERHCRRVKIFLFVTCKYANTLAGKQYCDNQYTHNKYVWGTVTFRDWKHCCRQKGSSGCESCEKMIGDKSRQSMIQGEIADCVWFWTEPPTKTTVFLPTFLFSLFNRFCFGAMAASLPQKAGMAGMPPLQQQPHLPPSGGPAAGQQPMPPQGALREISPVFLCRIGQETVQDIVTRTMEIFQITRATQVPGTRL